MSAFWPKANSPKLKRMSAFKGKAGITVDKRYETSETIFAVIA
jgi:hypothetical protein